MAVLSADSDDLFGWPLEEGAALVTLRELESLPFFWSLFSGLSWFSEWQSPGSRRGLLSDLTCANLARPWLPSALTGTGRL